MCFPDQPRLALLPHALAPRTFTSPRVLRQQSLKCRKGLQILAAQAMPAGTRRRIPILRGVVRGRVIARCGRCRGGGLHGSGYELHQRGRGRDNFPDLLLPVEVPVRSHPALSFRHAYRALAHLVVFEVLKGAVYICCSISCQGSQEAALRTDVIAFPFEHAAPAEVAWEVFCSHAVEPAHPGFQAAVIGVDVLNMKDARLRSPSRAQSPTWPRPFRWRKRHRHARRR